jgi:hypothetical protein
MTANSLFFLQDENMMQILTMLSNRIEHIENHHPKFKHVTKEAVNVLNHFFTLQLPSELQNAPNSQKLEYRKSFINKYVNQLPKNMELKYFSQKSQFIFNITYSHL